jgi:hypothetical protein
VAHETVDDGNGHDVPLRLYVERIFEEREKALTLAFEAQQWIFEKYEAELDAEHSAEDTAILQKLMAVGTSQERLEFLA